MFFCCCCFGVTQTINRECAKPFCFLFRVFFYSRLHRALIALFVCACLKQWYFEHLAVTPESHDADTGRDTPCRHSIQIETVETQMCYPLMWNVTLDATITHFSVLYIFPRPSTHKALKPNSVVILVSEMLGKKCSVPSEARTWDLWLANPIMLSRR